MGLGAAGDMALVYQIVEKALKISFSQLSRVALVMKEDIAPNPEFIGRFRAWAELAALAGQADLVKKSGFTV